MNTNRDLWSATDVSMPSGSEVDSAAFHPPVSAGEVVVPERGAGMRSRIDALKSRGTARLHDLEHRVHHLQHSVVGHRRILPGAGDDRALRGPGHTGSR